MKYKIYKLSELNNYLINKAISVLIDDLYDVFATISKDKATLEELFKDFLIYDMNYVCLIEGEVAGFIGIGDMTKRPTGKIKLETFEAIFHKRKAKILYKYIEQNFFKSHITSHRALEISFLATNMLFNNREVTTQLINFICTNFSYDYCLLDVLSKNKTDRKLYETLGFKPIKVSSNWILRLHGLGRTITMYLDIKERQAKLEQVRPSWLFKPTAKAVAP
ncbi:MAG: hypothetical protein FWE37_04350 [Spirochaetaceae bacterium]|nr:hypothetical protein [Spirochaetaceae bacterium]